MTDEGELTGTVEVPKKTLDRWRQLLETSQVRTVYAEIGLLLTGGWDGAFIPGSWLDVIFKRDYAELKQRLAEEGEDGVSETAEPPKPVDWKRLLGTNTYNELRGILPFSQMEEEER